MKNFEKTHKSLFNFNFTVLNFNPLILLLNSNPCRKFAAHFPESRIQKLN